MSEPTNSNSPSRQFWIISGVALVWNLLGIISYLMSFSMSPEALAAMTEAERALYTDIPAWVTSAYAIAVFGGTLGCVALLMRKAWAVPVFIVSLIAILLQMGYALFMTAMLEVNGATAAVMPLLIIAIAVYLVWFSSSSRQKGLIH